MSSKIDNTSTVNCISNDITDDEIQVTTLPRKRGRPPKAPTRRDQSDISSSAPKRNVGRPKKDMNAKEASLDTFAEVEEETESVKEIVEKKKIIKQRKRKMPIKLKWIEIVGKSRQMIPCSRLPFNRVVMQRYDYLRTGQSNATTINQYAQMLYEEIKKVWDRTSLPLLEPRACISRIERLLESWQKNDCRRMVTGSAKQIDYMKMLDSLCSMTYDDKEEILSKMKSKRLLNGTGSEKEDPNKEKIYTIEYNFLLNQMKNPQIGTIEGKDSILQEKERQKELREERKRMLE